MPHKSLFNTFGEPFPTFNTLLKQPHRNSYCCGKEIIQPLFVPNDRLSSFQIIKFGFSAVSSVEIYDYTDYTDDILVGTLPTAMFEVSENGAPPASANATTKFTYKGGVLSEISNLECDRQYYLKINFSDGTSRYTDVFKVYERCCLHLFEWSDDCDIGKINFTDTGYIKQAYVLNCELIEDSRQINVGGIEQADGSVIYREQRVDSWLNYTYRFAYGYMISAISAMTVHTYKRFYHSNGVFFDILNTEISTAQVAGRENCLYDISINMLQGNTVTKGFCCDNDIDFAPTYNLEPEYAGCDGDLPCPTPINVQITDVSTEEATLSFTETNIAVEFSFDGVAWLTAPSSPITLTGLMPCTNYTIYVRSNCGGQTSNVLTFTFTTLNTECEQASNLFVASQTIDTITLQWTPPTAIYVTGQIVEWREQGTTTWQGAGLSAVASTYTITGLNQNTVYEIRIKSLCTGNCIKESEYLFILFATEDCAIEISRNIATIDCNSTDANVTIQALNTTGNYTITVSNNSYSNTVSNIDFVDNLDFGTYQIAVQDDTCTKLDTITVSENCNCDIPTALEVITVTDTTATLNWTDSPNADSYCLEYRDVTVGTWVTIPNILPPISAYEVTGLIACTNYEFRVKAKCGVFESDYSNIVQLSTTGCTNGGGNDCEITLLDVGSVCQGETIAIGVIFSAQNTSTANVVVTIDNGVVSSTQTVLASTGNAVFLNVFADGSTYTVTVQDETLPNCNDATNIQIQSIVQIISVNIVSCENGLADIEVNLNLNGATSYTYTLTDSANNIIDSGTGTTNLLLLSDVPENDNYEIEIETDNNCISSQAFNIDTCENLCPAVGIGLQNTGILEVTATLILPAGASLVLMDIDWGDTTTVTGLTTTVNTWTYVSAGTYTICMIGSYLLNGLECQFDICDSITISNDICETCEIEFSNIVVNHSTVTTPNIAGDGSISFDVSGCDGSNGYSLVAITRELCITINQQANNSPTSPNTCNGQKILFYDANQSAVTLQNLPVLGNSWVMVGGSSFVVNGLSYNGNTNGTQYEFTIWDNVNGCQGSLQASIFAITNPCNIILNVAINCLGNEYVISRWLLEYVNTSNTSFNVYIDNILYTNVLNDGTGFQILDATVNPFFPLTIPADGQTHTIEIVDANNIACSTTVTFDALPC